MLINLITFGKVFFFSLPILNFPLRALHLLDFGLGNGCFREGISRTCSFASPFLRNQKEDKNKNTREVPEGGLSPWGISLGFLKHSAL